MSVHYAVKQEGKKKCNQKKKKSMSAPDDFWPDSKRPDFNSESPDVLSAGVLAQKGAL